MPRARRCAAPAWLAGCLLLQRAASLRRIIAADLTVLYRYGPPLRSFGVKIRGRVISENAILAKSPPNRACGSSAYSAQQELSIAPLYVGFGISLTPWAVILVAPAAARKCERFAPRKLIILPFVPFLPLTTPGDPSRSRTTPRAHIVFSTFQDDFFLFIECPSMKFWPAIATTRRHNYIVRIQTPATSNGQQLQTAVAGYSTQGPTMRRNSLCSTGGRPTRT